MEKQALRFSVMGDNGDLHEVVIERDSVDIGNLQAHCSCGDAQHGDLCAHRFEVLEGDISNVVSENLDDVQMLREWIKGSDIEVAMQNLSKAKTELKLAFEKVEHCRKILVRRMLD